MSYAPHHAFVAPARASAEFWRIVLGVLLLVAIFLGLNWSLYGVAHFVAGPEDAAGFAAMIDDPDTPIGALSMLLRLGFLAVATVMTARALHHRGLRSLTGPPRRALTQGSRVLVALALLYVAILILPPREYGVAPVSGAEFSRWLALLPLSLVVVLIQSASEEIAFRGYLQQQLAARFASPLVWMAIPSALFGLLHYAPATNGETSLFVALWAVFFGLAAADLTARSGTLGPAIAFHFFNNISAILILSVDGYFDTLALYVLPVDFTDIDAMRPLLIVDLAVLALGWLCARLAIRA